jgi:hypothetical protein
VSTLAREEIRVPEARIDARAAANALLAARHGTPEECAQRLEEGRAVVETAPRAPGRGGVRMAALERVVAALVARLQPAGSSSP